MFLIITFAGSIIYIGKKSIFFLSNRITIIIYLPLQNKYNISRRIGYILVISIFSRLRGLLSYIRVGIVGTTINN